MITVTSLPIYLSVQDAIKASSLGKTYLYELISTNRIKSFVVGKRRLIDTASLIAFIESHPFTADVKVPTSDAFTSTK